METRPFVQLFIKRILSFPIVVYCAPSTRAHVNNAETSRRSAEGTLRLEREQSRPKSGIPMLPLSPKQVVVRRLFMVHLSFFKLFSFT